eukprot:Selendium_serpulae@DN4043_c0_g1_i3.p1
MFENDKTSMSQLLNTCAKFRCPIGNIDGKKERSQPRHNEQPNRKEFNTKHVSHFSHLKKQISMDSNKPNDTLTKKHSTNVVFRSGHRPHSLAVEMPVPAGGPQCPPPHHRHWGLDRTLICAAPHSHSPRFTTSATQSVFEGLSHDVRPLLSRHMGVDLIKSSAREAHCSRPQPFGVAEQSVLDRCAPPSPDDREGPAPSTSRLGGGTGPPTGIAMNDEPTPRRRREAERRFHPRNRFTDELGIITFLFLFVRCMTSYKKHPRP